MGYTTEFSGSFTLNKKLKPEHKLYLAHFARTRRIKRDGNKTEALKDAVREAAKLPVGVEGGYFVGASGFAGQDETPDVVEYNNPPKGQPGLWCQWVPNEDGDTIEWDGGEKFYYYVEWLQYIIDHFLTPWKYEISGKVKWQGEYMDDRGLIIVKKNKISTKELE